MGEFARSIPPEAQSGPKEGPSILDQFMPTEVAHSLTDVDLEEYHNAGVNTLLLDAEGTIVENNGYDADSGAIDFLNYHRRAGNIQNIAIISNKRPKDEATFLKIAWWAEQIGADIVFVPLDASERKPSSKMLLKALQFFNISADEALMVGDKVTSDIRAANFAGVRSVWVRRYGSADLPGDRFVRRPTEEVWRVSTNLITKREEKLHESAAAKALAAIQEREIYEAIEGEIASDWNPDLLPEEFLALSNKISGYGGPMVELYPAVEEAIPDMWYAPVTQELTQLINALAPHYHKAQEEFKTFMREHGHTVADTLTHSRIPAAFLVGGLVLAGKDKLAQMAHVIAISTDFFDGPAARMSRRGPTEEGGRRDQRIDKLFSIVVELALLLKGRISFGDFVLRTGRDVVMTSLIRRLFDRAGMDTSAVFSGKASTSVSALADNIAISPLASNRPELNGAIQHGATGAKLYSFFRSPPDWTIRRERKRHEEIRQGQIRKELERRTNEG